jgi:hypothetical protein
MVAIAMPKQLQIPDGALAIWTLYDHPHDYPHGYVLRPQFAMAGGEIEISQIAWYARDPDELRAILPPGLVRMDRHPDDDPSIIEVWL